MADGGPDFLILSVSDRMPFVPDSPASSDADRSTSVPVTHAEAAPVTTTPSSFDTWLGALTPHLIELRQRMVRAGLAVLVVFLSLVYWSANIFHLLARPLLANLPSDGRMIVTDVTGSFFIPMKVTLLVSFVIALPVVLHQLWRFVAPGLYQHERALLGPVIGSSYVLFLTGMAFAYVVVFPAVFHVMQHYNAPLGAQMSTDIERYLSFAMTTFMAFGLTFEVPVLVVLMVRLGLVTRERLGAARRYVIVGAFVVSAVVTPPDVFSQLILAMPLILLYEVGLLVARWTPPRRTTDDRADGTSSLTESLPS